MKLDLRSVAILWTAGPRAKNIWEALVWMFLFTKLFFKLSFVKTLMPQSGALSKVMNHLSVFFAVMSCTKKRYIFRVFGLSGPRPSYPALNAQPLAPAPGSHKSFNKLNLLLIKVQSLWSWAHYFQWFTVYLNLTYSGHMYMFLKKLPHCLMWT